MELKESKVAQTGGRQIDINEYLNKLEKVDDAYDAIRNATDDITTISKNANMPEWKIQKIKDHVFKKEHILDDGIRRFDADVEIADAWKRLAEGKHNLNDLDLLKHEYFEAKFEKFFKTDYRTAHGKTIESGRVWDPYKEID